MTNRTANSTTRLFLLSLDGRRATFTTLAGILTLAVDLLFVKTLGGDVACARNFCLKRPCLSEFVLLSS